MTPSKKRLGLDIHDNPELFRKTIQLSAKKTGFIPRLVEKDYFCTLVLHYLTSKDNALVFKGGTCLAKVHAGFYRLSEDLDFMFSVPQDMSQSARSRRVSVIKDAVHLLREEYPVFHVRQELTGANRSRQYIGSVEYGSVIDKDKGTIKIEVGLREPLHEAIIQGAASTILLNPGTEKAMMSPVTMPCISLREAMAEKFRAAFTRIEAAIRDFYDIDYAVRFLGFDVADDTFLELVRKKLAVPGNGAVDLSESRLSSLRSQLDSHLRPVLRPQDFKSFDLDHALGVVSGVSSILESPGSSVSRPPPPTP